MGAQIHYVVFGTSGIHMYMVFSYMYVYIDLAIVLRKITKFFIQFSVPGALRDEMKINEFKPQSFHTFAKGQSEFHRRECSEQRALRDLWPPRALEWFH